MTYQRILVPIDFSDDSLDALNSAVTEFCEPTNTLVLLHVVETMGEESGAAHMLSRGRMQAVSRADITTEESPVVDPMQLRLDQLRSLAVPFAGTRLNVETLVSAGNPTDKIIEMAKLRNIDLVIMGSHGAGGLGQLLFGSTTYDVARKLKCSVLINKRI